MANGEILFTHGAGTTSIEVTIDGTSSYICLNDIHCCPKIDCNLISLGYLNMKECEYQTSGGILSVMDPVGDTLLQAKCKGKFYPLLRPKDFDHYTPPIVNAYKITKPQTVDLWHHHLGHVNKKDPNDRKSRNGYIVFMARGPVAWKSTKHTSVALSSTEAEYMRQTIAATNGMWARGFCQPQKWLVPFPTTQAILMSARSSRNGRNILPSSSISITSRARTRPEVDGHLLSTGIEYMEIPNPGLS